MGDRETCIYISANRKEMDWDEHMGCAQYGQIIGPTQNMKRRWLACTASHLVYVHSLFNQWNISLIEQTVCQTLQQKSTFMCLNLLLTKFVSQSTHSLQTSMAYFMSLVYVWYTTSHILHHLRQDCSFQKINWMKTNAFLFLIFFNFIMTLKQLLLCCVSCCFYRD